MPITATENWGANLVSPSNWWLDVKQQSYHYGFIVKRFWWILLLTIAIGLGIAAAVITHTPPSYRSLARMMVSGKINLPENGVVYSEDLMNFYGTQIELMESAEVRTRAFARMTSLNPDLPASTLKNLQLNVVQEPKTSIFQLSVIAPLPDLAKNYLDACMEEYIANKREMRSQKSDVTVTALAKELTRVEQDLQTHEDDLLNFQKENNLGYLQEEGNSAAAYLARLTRELAELKTEYQLLGLLNLDQNLNRPAFSGDSTPQSPDRLMSGFGPISDYLKTKQEIQIIKSRRDQALKMGLRPQHPDVVNLDQVLDQETRLIEGYRQQALDELESRRQGIKLQMQNHDESIAEWEKKAADYSRRLAEYDILKGKTDRIKAEYDRLFTSLRNVDVNKTVDQDMISVLERAQGAYSVKPGMPRIITLGVLGGFLVGGVILFVLGRIDDRLTSFSNLSRSFSLPTLGYISHESKTGNVLPLLSSLDQRHSFVEAFRNLRSSLIFLPVEGERPKAFLVTSAIPGEGKSTTASNLAVAMALSGSRTLLIDCDLRRGALHESLGTKREPGFTEVVQNKIPWSKAIQSTPIEHLFFLPRGLSIPHPGELLLSPQTNRFLQEVYKEFDYLIFDSAPILAADDTLNLAPKLDAVLCVARMDSSSQQLVRKTLELLRLRQANVLGLVANDVDVRTTEYGRYRYSYQYGPQTTSDSN